MRPRLRWSGVLLFGIFVVLCVLLLLLRDVLLRAHVDETILKFASDASVYYEAYQAQYADVALLETPALFLVGSPILFLRLAGGELVFVQLANLLLMFYCLHVALGCLRTFQGRLAFLALALVFPYFAFGFLGLNKEVYAMSSAILFGAWLVRGCRRHLVLALLVGACARYYMVIALVALVFTVPRARPPRYALVVAMLLAISLVAPFALSMIPEYSNETVLEDSGRIGLVFASLIGQYGYIVAYPLKFVLLMPTRFYGFLVGASADVMGAGVALLSMAMFVSSCVVFYRSRDPMVRRLIVAGWVAPVPIMWSEIMHWRYYAFVYFFWLYAIVLHAELARVRRREARSAASGPAGALPP